MGKRPLSLTAIVLSVISSQALPGHVHTSNEDIHNVLVTAPDTGTPPGASHIDDRHIHTHRAATSDAAGLLRNLPGVSLYGAGGVSGLPVIHGLADDRLRVRLDGMDLVSACANHMNPPLSYTAPTAVTEMTVYAGVSPVSVGGDSIGGSIIVNSAQPQFAVPGTPSLVSGEAGTFYRSNGDSQGIFLNGTLASANLSLRYQGSFARADNYRAAASFKPAGPAALDRQWLDGDEVGSSAFESHNHKIGLAFQHRNHSIDLEAGYQHIPYQGFPNQRMDMLDNTSTRLVVRHRGEYSWGEVETRIYREETRHSMNFGDDKQFRYGDAPGMPMETEGVNTGFATTASYNLSARDLLRLGAEIQLYSLDDWWPPSGTGMMMAPATFWNIRDGERDREALFAEWEAQWTPHWQSILGIRHERVTSDSGTVQGYSMMYQAEAAAFNGRSRDIADNNWDFSAQVRFSPSERQRYEAGLARKTRSPNLYERYSWSSVGMAMRMVNLAGDGNGYVGNLDLEPEIAHTLSLTADWHDPSGEHWQVILTPYLTLVDDFIDATPCKTMMCRSANMVPGFRYLTFANQDARLWGLDLSAFRHLATLESLGTVHLKIIASHIDGENRTTGDNLYNIMPLNGTLILEQSKGRWTNSLEWQVVDAKDQVSAVRNEVATAGYGLLNLRGSYATGRLRVDLGIENLLDKSHRLPLGGAYVGQGMTMSATGAPWGTAVPGPGLSVYGAVTYGF